MTKALRPSYTIMLVDDERITLENYDYALHVAGMTNLLSIADSRAVIDALNTRSVGIVVLDLMMPHVSGNELLTHILEHHPDVKTIVVTARDEVTSAVSCMKNGAVEYLVKPVDTNVLITAVLKAMNSIEQEREVRGLRESLFQEENPNADCFSRIITRNKTMHAIFRYINGIAKTTFPVLVCGETGVGKELVAEAVHRVSGRAGKFVAVNSAGFTDTLFTDALFGHAKGAFTGADSDRQGLVASAEQGTLFLDEIGELEADSQVKLLRFLQDNVYYYPLGSDAQRFGDVRIIAATNKSIDSLKAADTFRTDLFYRLQTHTIVVPPLRERTDDIMMLTEYFIRDAARRIGISPPALGPDVAEVLRSYSFPGNVRELQALVFDAVSTATGGVLSRGSLLRRISPYTRSAVTAWSGCNSAITTSPPDNRGIVFSDILPPLDCIEQLEIEEALKRTNGNQTHAADLLGVSRKALNSRLVRMRQGKGEGG